MMAGGGRRVGGAGYGTSLSLPPPSSSFLSSFLFLSRPFVQLLFNFSSSSSFLLLFLSSVSCYFFSILFFSIYISLLFLLISLTLVSFPPCTQTVRTKLSIQTLYVCLSVCVSYTYSTYLSSQLLLHSYLDILITLVILM